MPPLGIRFHFHQARAEHPDDPWDVDAVAGDDEHQRERHLAGDQDAAQQGKDEGDEDDEDDVDPSSWIDEGGEG